MIGLVVMGGTRSSDCSTFGASLHPTIVLIRPGSPVHGDVDVVAGMVGSALLAVTGSGIWETWNVASQYKLGKGWCLMCC